MNTDEQIRKDVEEEVKWSPELRTIATEIGIAVKDNIVTLTGVVDTFRRKLLSSPGVSVVQNWIVIENSMAL